MTDKKSVLVVSGFISNPNKFDSHIQPISEVADTKAICIKPSPSCEGVTFRQVPTFGSKIIGIAMIALIGIYECLSKDYDQIVTYSLIPYGVIGLMLKTISRTPVHLGIIGSDLDVHAPAQYGRFVKWCFRQFDTISVKGSTYEEQLINYGIPSERIYQLFNPPSPKFESATPSVEPTYDLLWLSRMSTEKDPYLFVNILNELRNRDLEFTAAMVGGGPLEEEINACIKEQKLEDVVDLPGWTDEPMEYFEDSSIYVLTSDRDMLPISLLEAMYCGAIPVCPSIGAMPDIVDHDVNGILVEPGRTQEYVDQIEGLLKSEEKRPMIRENVLGIRDQISHEAAAQTWKRIISSQ